MDTPKVIRAFRVLSFEAEPEMQMIPCPEPGPGEVLIRIEACALNFADLLMAKGTYQATPPPPFTSGLELSGIVEVCGDGVRSPSPGTRVAVFSGQGGLADYGTFPADRCIPIPEDMSFEGAAAFQIAYGTSHLALTRRARLQKGETLLVLGAAGGVGLTAVEVGKLLGARVIAAARGEEKCAIARQAGADHVIDAGGDLKSMVRSLGGADVVYDPVGGDLFPQVLSATKPEGRILIVGFAAGKVPEIKANHLLVKNIDVIGFYWGGYLEFRPDALADSLKTLLDHFSAGNLKPHISHRLPLSRAAEGLDLLRHRRATGKVVITMSE